jgi:hypothetical protein
LTLVGVDLTNYTNLTHTLCAFKVRQSSMCTMQALIHLLFQDYPIVGVTPGRPGQHQRHRSLGITIATKLHGDATINAATFTNSQNAGTMKSPARFTPFFVPPEVTTDGGTDWYYGWAKFSDGDLTLDSYAFANSANTAVGTPCPNRAHRRCLPSEQRESWRFAAEAGAWLRPSLN